MIHPNFRRRWVGCLVLLLGMLFGNGSVFAHATKPLPRVTLSGKVLFGDSKAFRAVGTVDRRVVFESIPAMRTLRAERVAKDTARYHFLIYEANREFQRAVATVALRQSVDLVVEAGGVAAAGIDVIDLTSVVVACVSPAKKR